MKTTLKILLRTLGVLTLGVAVQGVYSSGQIDMQELTTSGIEQEDTTSVSEPIDLPYPIVDEKGNTPEEKLSEEEGIRLSKPISLKTEVEYDPETDEYRIVEKVSEFEVNTPYSMKSQEYYKMMSDKQKNDYWRVRAKGNRTGDNSAYSPTLSIGSEAFNKVFGNSSIDIVPQGSAELSFGVKYTDNKNTALTRKQQRDLSFEFDNKIQMNVTGKVGDKLSLTVKYDTEAQFEIDNERKIEYVGEEDEIIKKIEIGDVSFPSGNSLITGSQSLMGFKTEMQFGKLYVTSVLSRKKGESSTINVEGGAQKEEFEIRADDYEDNKHYLLSHYFRVNYEKAFENTPYVSNGAKITGVEVWVTQTTSSSRNDARDILAVTDLGDVKIDENTYQIPDNNMKMYKNLKNSSGIRNKNSVHSAVKSAYPDFREGYDYNFVEQAVRLSESQYEVNVDLGYISLRSPMDPSKILGVSFRYEFKGEQYQVGDFATGGDDSSSVLIVKMLKSVITGPSVNNWDLMMKNVYNIGGYQISGDDFLLDIMYEDDKTGMPVNYLPDGVIKGKSLLSVMNLDSITVDKQPYPDGMFDFLPGYTVDPKSGRIYFPVLEPFGSHLEKQIVTEGVAENYVYKELYDTTQVAARQESEKNKFLIRGSYKSSVSSEISLNATNVAEGSVIVTAAGMTLSEGEDYEVDYALGRLRILNKGLLESGTPIQVNLESNSLFNTKVKSFMGNRLEYRFNDNMSLGATMLRLSERVSTSKVGFEDYPINNRMWGFDGRASHEVPFLTVAVDKGIPFVKTKEKSNISFEAEYAQINPNEPKGIKNAVEIDYFENTQRKVFIKEPSAWRIASTPQGQRKLFPEGDRQDLANGYNRAHIAWYDINYSLYNNSSPAGDEAQSEYFSRAVLEKNLFENRDNETYSTRPMSILNLAYFPKERGPYNFDIRPSGVSRGIDSVTGNLIEPQTRWGGIMRELSTTDFEQANVEYVEFWMLDPFVYDSLETHSGGDLYINLGMLSEDVLKDGRKSFENGLLDDPNSYEETEWARVPLENSVNNGFDNSADRAIQDVGLDGVGDNQEKSLFRGYLSELKGYLTSEELYNAWSADPANDNFVSYIDDAWDGNTLLYERYKYYNGVDGNTPDNSQGSNVQGSGRLRPDVEDINDDNTLQTNESYFQYRVSIRPEDLEVGKNYIVDKITEEDNNLPNNGNITADWYQFKIPLNTANRESFGGIGDFQSIQFMRMFLKGFSDSVILRFAEFSLLRSDWRKYEKELYELGDYDIFNDSEFDVSVVNIEENNSKTPVNYILPPGVDREQDPLNPQLRELNEQSIALKVVDLEDGNSKAIYKMIYKDLRPFKKLKMFVHAEALKGQEDDLKDGEVYAFIRLGSDQTKNYYEYEIPLILTPHNKYNNRNEGDRHIVWPDDNNFDINLDDLVELKKLRNELVRDSIQYPDLLYTHIFYGQDGANRISVKGNPNLGNIRTVMIGVRNRKKSASNTADFGNPVSCEVWFNEMRLTDFDDIGGWAARASTRIDLADFATVSVAGKTSRAGFGSLDQRVFERSQEDLYQYDVSTNVALSKFFPEKFGIRIPFYFGLSETFINPKYDPTNPDILFDETLETLDGEAERVFLQKAQDYTRRNGFNFTNVRIDRNAKIKHPLNISNFSVGYAYTNLESHNINLKNDREFTQKASFGYNLNLRPKAVEPFKSIKKKQLRIIKDFNFYYLPSTFSFTNDWYQSYRETVRWNLSDLYGATTLDPTYSNKYNISRKYNLNYNISKSLKFSYVAANNSRIRNLHGRIESPENEQWQQFWQYLDDPNKTTDFNQKVSASYKIPINKIQPLDWVSSNYSYDGTYAWLLGPELRDKNIDLGNDIKNSGSHGLNTTLSLTKLYSKSDYLSEVSKRVKRGSRGNSTTKTVKYTNERLSLKAGKPKSIKHNLGTEDLKVNVLDENGKLVKIEKEIISSKKVVITADADVKKGKVIITGKKDSKQSILSESTDEFVNLLMMTKNASLDYSVTNGSFIPGFLNESQMFGMANPFDANTRSPMIAYVFGYVPKSGIDDTFLENEWITRDATFSGRFKQTYSEDIKFKATLEPLQSMRITVNSDYKFSKNYDRSLAGASEKTKENAITSGNYSVSFNSIKTSFNSDKAFSDLRKYRGEVGQLLAERSGQDYVFKEGTNIPSIYSETSPEILIPAFIAAYSGQSPKNIDLENYFSPNINSLSDFVRSLNWRLTYNGLSKMKSLKKYFRSININHSYQSTYSIGSYQSYSNSDLIDFLDDGPSFTSSGSNIFIAPDYEFSNVKIVERFAPLIGVDMRWKNSLSSKFEVKSNRDVSLSFINTEVSESNGFEFVVGAGYVVKAFKVSFNNGTSYENDLNLRMDFSVRNNLIQRRNVITNVTQTVSGRKIYSLKAYADYKLNDRFSMRVFYDHLFNKPLTNGFNNTTASLGVNFRFSLAQ